VERAVWPRRGKRRSLAQTCSLQHPNTYSNPNSGSDTYTTPGNTDADVNAKPYSHSNTDTDTHANTYTQAGDAGKHFDPATSRDR
jgi:hypothetical protein